MQEPAIGVEKPLKSDDNFLLDMGFLSVWKRIAESIGFRDERSWSEVLRWRCASRSRLAKLRELRVLARRMSVSRRDLIFRGARLSRFAPLDLLRVAALIDRLIANGVQADQHRRIEKDLVNAMDQLTTMFHVSEGSPLQRAKELYRVVT